MEVTEIILAKVSRLCQLSSHSHGFLSRLQIFTFIGPSLWISVAHKTPSYDTKMLLKVVIDKTAFLSNLRLVISYNFKQNFVGTEIYFCLFRGHPTAGSLSSSQPGRPPCSSVLAFGLIVQKLLVPFNFTYSLPVDPHFLH
jgi:hypothetical protein